MSDVQRPPFAERCRAEATRDVIFLLQRRVYQHLGCPDGYEFDPEGECVAQEPDEGVRARLTSEELTKEVFGDWDTPCAVEEWQTVGVFLSREEAEAFARRTEYRYPGGWRVYGTCAEGELAELIKVT